MRVTKKDFEKYKSEFKEWQRKFNCGDWEVFFKLEDSVGVQASCTSNTPNRIATVALSRNVESGETIEGLAFHEAAELFLAKFRFLIGQKSVTTEQEDEAVHSAINTLQELLVEKSKWR